MPSEYTTATNVAHDDQQTLDQQPVQLKFCSMCHVQLSDPAHAAFLPQADMLVCSSCRGAVYTARHPLLTRPSCLDIESDFLFPPPFPDHLHNTRRNLGTDLLIDNDSHLEHSQSPDNPHPFPSAHLPPFTALPSIKPTPPTIHTNLPPSTPYSQSYSAVHPPPSRRESLPPSSTSPLTDITRLRVRSQAHHCLYPGAVFQGTQKSGRNSYDVNVTIVDVDFTTSFLCGYLRIRGLTDDWPELTTYFDAEIIGSRYGFLTQNWGANEQEDMVHWSCFPAFGRVKHELEKPLLTMPDRDRGAVFMRWKERFLVPDHRVQDINGASFAGFYYVCVDFNPAASSVSMSQSASQIPEEGMNTEMSEDVLPAVSPIPAPKQEPLHHSWRARRDSSVRRGTRSTSRAPRHNAPAATMSGFYFHQYSEPYQELSLSHVPERTSSTFEFR